MNIDNVNRDFLNLIGCGDTRAAFILEQYDRYRHETQGQQGDSLLCFLKSYIGYDIYLPNPIESNACKNGLSVLDYLNCCYIAACDVEEKEGGI